MMQRIVAVLAIVPFLTMVSPPANAMSIRHVPTPNPLANSSAIVNVSDAAVTILAEGLFRVQLGAVGQRDDRPTYQVVNRRAPVPKFTVEQNSSDSITVVTTRASVYVSVSENRTASPQIVFTCKDASVGGDGLWSWNPDIDPSKDLLQSGMPINQHGMYVLDDSDTARLGGDDAHDIAWWEYPLNTSTQPPNPHPAPVTDTCVHPQYGVDVGPGATRHPQFPNGWNCSSYSLCCDQCNAITHAAGCNLTSCKAPPCVSWTFAPVDDTCWLFSTVASIKNTSLNRTYGGASQWPIRTPSHSRAPVDLYLFCYGTGQHARGHRSNNEAKGLKRHRSTTLQPSERRPHLREPTPSSAAFTRGMQQLTTITGSPPMMPLAAYGVWYSGCCIPDL